MISDPYRIRALYQPRDVAREYSRVRFSNATGALLHQREVHWVNRALQNRRPCRVLEIACGPGRLTAELQFEGAGVALDASCEMLAAAREAVKASERSMNWQFLRGDAFRLPFHEAFDFVVSFRLIRHFVCAERRMLYAEVRSALRPQGVFLMDALNRRGRPGPRLPKPTGGFGDLHDEAYTEVELRRELVESGFGKVEFFPVLCHRRLQGQITTWVGPRWPLLAHGLVRLLEFGGGVTVGGWVVKCMRA